MAAPALALALALAAAGPGQAQHHVPGADPKYPRVKYADSLVSVNDRCIVSQARLNHAMRPVYVNGQPIGFC